MSNDKPTATATIKFYANKHVTVDMDGIKGLTPRTIDIASNILLKTYRGMRHAHNVKEHRAARANKADMEIAAAEEEAAFHIAEDERLAKAALADMPKGEPVKVEKEIKEKEVPVVTPVASEVAPK